MAKGIKVDEVMTVIRTGSRVVGCMTWETPYVVFASSSAPNGELHWVSNNVEYSEAYLLNPGDKVHIKAFYRTYNDVPGHEEYHLYKVQMKGAEVA